MLKIYVQNKPLYLIDKPISEIERLRHQQTTVYADELNNENVAAVLQKLETNQFTAGIYQHYSLNDLLQAFKSQLTVVQAAGGLVFTPEKEILLIYRRGKWDLPKGKLEEGENLEACALREVEEETGLRDIKNLRPLAITYHTYYERGKHILKESHWYLMKCKSALPLRPQAEEDIEQCVWVTANKVPAYLPAMHASLVDAVLEGMKQIIEES